MSHKMLRAFIVNMSVLGYFPLQPSIYFQLVILYLSCVLDALRHDILMHRLEILSINGIIITITW